MDTVLAHQGIHGNRRAITSSLLLIHLERPLATGRGPEEEWRRGQAMSIFSRGRRRSERMWTWTLRLVKRILYMRVQGGKICGNDMSYYGLELRENTFGWRSAESCNRYHVMCKIRFPMKSIQYKFQRYNMDPPRALSHLGLIEYTALSCLL